MKTFGLIGYPLKHSFSPKFFNDKFEKESIDAKYLNYEIEDIHELRRIIVFNPHLKGLNVTIPYKETVIPFLDEIAPAAKEIGAVNVIKIERVFGNSYGYKLIGHNTDYVGFKQSIAPLVKSELVKVVEVVDDKLNEKLDEVDKRYSEIVNILSKLSAYFDNSIAVSETAKQELREALADAAKTSNNADVDIGVAVEHAEAEKPAEEEKTASPTVTR